MSQQDPQQTVTPEQPSLGVPSSATPLATQAGVSGTEQSTQDGATQAPLARSEFEPSAEQQQSAGAHQTGQQIPQPQTMSRQQSPQQSQPQQLAQQQAPQQFQPQQQIRRHGDRVDIPDLASNVDVEPVGTDGRVRVTYLVPTRQLDVGEDADPAYVD